jgi:nitrate reductase delta subunit
VNVFRLLSLLLDYPEREPAAAGHELEQLPPGEASAAIAAFLRSCQDLPLGELQAEYVRTFDFDRRASLYLTWHAHGDRRQRGLELVRLKRRFRTAGLELADAQLPDYLPVLLEFAAFAPAGEGEALLAEQRPALELVRSALHEGGSRYAPLLDALVALLPALTAAQRERARRLAEEGPPAELVGLEPVLTVPEEVAG